LKSFELILRYEVLLLSAFLISIELNAAKETSFHALSWNGMAYLIGRIYGRESEHDRRSFL